MTTEPTPPGYMKNAQGHLVPESAVRDIDKQRDQVVRELAAEAEQLSRQLREYKRKVADSVQAHVELSADRHGVKLGGKKGNVSLTSFDGSLKVQRAFADRIDFDEGLLAAKELVDQCLAKWSDGANVNLRTLVDRAFDVDKKGKVNTQLLLSLMRYEFQDDDWNRAMDALRESITVVSSAVYFRLYRRRDEASDQYDPITLDFAAL